MTQRIITTNDNGLTVAIIVPHDSLTAEFCIKDVPTGHHYKIVDTADVPSDRDFRDAWEVTVDSTWSIK
jgi:hypothetical protein